MQDNIKEDIKIKIISILLENQKSGLSVSEIGKKTKKDRQTIYYHLKELKRLGLILKTDSDKYCLQNILYKDTQEFSIIHNELKNIYSKTKELLILDNIENKDKSTTDNLSIFLLLHIKSEIGWCTKLFLQTYIYNTCVYWFNRKTITEE